MIQDIIPHQYDNHYIEYQPQITDFCICIKDGTVLLCQDKKEKNSWYIPTFKELAEPLYGAVYYRHLKIQKDLREHGKTDVICVR